MNILENMTFYREKWGLPRYTLSFLLWFEEKIRKIPQIISWEMATLEPLNLALYCNGMSS